MDAPDNATPPRIYRNFVVTARGIAACRGFRQSRQLALTRPASSERGNACRKLAAALRALGATAELAQREAARGAGFFAQRAGRKLALHIIHITVKHVAEVS